MDVAIVRFDKDYQVLQDFLPVEQMMRVNLPANGNDTIYSPSIREALRMVDERRRLYARLAAPYKPWILFITDGAPNSSDDISTVAAEIRSKMSAGDLSFRSLAVGNFESSALHRLSPIVLRLQDQNFTDYFDWVAKSMARVSRSTPGQAQQEVNLGGNVRIDQDMSRFNNM